MLARTCALALLVAVCTIATSARAETADVALPDDASVEMLPPVVVCTGMTVRWLNSAAMATLGVRRVVSSETCPFACAFAPSPSPFEHEYAVAFAAPGSYAYVVYTFGREAPDVRGVVEVATCADATRAPAPVRTRARENETDGAAHTRAAKDVARLEERLPVRPVDDARADAGADAGAAAAAIATATTTASATHTHTTTTAAPSTHAATTAAPTPTRPEMTARARALDETPETAERERAARVVTPAPTTAATPSPTPLSTVAPADAEVSPVVTALLVAAAAVLALLVVISMLVNRTPRRRGVYDDTAIGSGLALAAPRRR